MGSIKSGARCVRNFDPVYVGLGSFSDVGLRSGDVGLTPVSGHRRPDCSGPNSAISGLMHRTRIARAMAAFLLILTSGLGSDRV